MPKCPLCELENLTKIYYEDDKISVRDCLTCKAPMIIFKRHGPDSDIPLNWKLFAGKKAKELFGEQIYFRTRPKKITSHQHWHVLNRKEWS